MVPLVVVLAVAVFNIVSCGVPVTVVGALEHAVVPHELLGVTGELPPVGSIDA